MEDTKLENVHIPELVTEKSTCLLHHLILSESMIKTSESHRNPRTKILYTDHVPMKIDIQCIVMKLKRTSKSMRINKNRNR